MIYVTGDTHAELNEIIERRKPDGSVWTTDDKLIICGDFGFVFNTADEKGEYKDDAKLDYIAEYLPQQILFVSGNHENFDRLYSYRDVPLYGGVAKEIRKGKIYLLKRGECYTIEGRTWRYSVFGAILGEGIKGAEATASAIFLARTGKSKDEIHDYIFKEYGYDLTMI